MRILLAEDDKMIGEAVRTALRQDGYTVDWVRDGRAAEVALVQVPHEHFDLALLDLGLPQQDGLAVLRAARLAGRKLPIIIITARDGIGARVTGLDAGADDYLVKPFDLDELAARIRSTLRRSTGQVEPERHLGDIHIQPATRSVRRGDQPVTLSAREYAIVDALITRLGAILSRAQLEERLYGWSDEVESNAVEVHIHSIRRKLGADFIRNVRGVGYYIAKPEQTR